MDIDKLFQTLDDDVRVLRDAVECDLYGTRSIVGDQVLKIEHQIKDIKCHLTKRSSRAAGACACYFLNKQLINAHPDCPVHRIKPPPA